MIRTTGPVGRAIRKRGLIPATVLCGGLLAAILLSGAATERGLDFIRIIIGTGDPISNLVTAYLVYHEDFDHGDADWYCVNTDDFDPPYCYYESEKLKLNPQGSDYCYGYWESPQIDVYEEDLYRAVFLVSAYTDNDREVPTFRMRITGTSPDDVRFQSVAMLVVNSTGNGNYSPTTDPEYYEVYFRTPNDLEKVRLEFELLSFDGVNDNPDVTVRLEEVWLELLR